MRNQKKNSRGKTVGYDIKGDDGKTYFAHLGDVQENENILYDLRNHKLSDIDVAYDHFDEARLEKDQKVKFREWDGGTGNKFHAFNVKRLPR